MNISGIGGYGTIGGWWCGIGSAGGREVTCDMHRWWCNIGVTSSTGGVSTGGGTKVVIETRIRVRVMTILR